MSDESGGPRAFMAGGVDYKTLFLGSCTLIVLVSGAAFRLWDGTNQRDSQDTSHALESIERRLALVEASAIEYRFHIAQLQQENKELKAGHDAQNRAIYNVEHSLMQMERHR